MIQYLHSMGYRLETAGRTPRRAGWRRGLGACSALNPGFRKNDTRNQGAQTGFKPTRARVRNAEGHTAALSVDTRLLSEGRDALVGCRPASAALSGLGSRCCLCEPLRGPEDRSAAHTRSAATRGPSVCPLGGLSVRARAHRESGDLSLNPGKTLAPSQPGLPPSIPLLQRGLTQGFRQLSTVTGAGGYRGIQVTSVTH